MHLTISQELHLRDALFTVFLPNMTWSCIYAMHSFFKSRIMLHLPNALFV